jgi:hypothetical protein
MNTADLIAEIDRVADSQTHEASWLLYHAKAKLLIMEERMEQIRRLVELPYIGKFNQEFESPLI